MDIILVERVKRKGVALIHTLIKLHLCICLERKSSPVNILSNIYKRIDFNEEEVRSCSVLVRHKVGVILNLGITTVPK